MNVIEHADMSKHTSFRAGGSARELVIVDNTEELASLLDDLNKEGREYIFLGNGSNTLFSDGEYAGTVIKIGETFDYVKTERISEEESLVTSGAGTLLSRVAKAAAADCLTGLEFAAGIPGSIGGGVFMNAGAYDGEIKQVLKSVKVLRRKPHGDTSVHISEGNTETEKNSGFEVVQVSNEELELGYRHSKLMETGEIVLEATFLLKKGDKETIDGLMKELSEKRISKQPLEYPSAGSFFKRPTGDFAGRLIQEAGLKGLSVGGAQVSDKHAGFIINKGNATATDIVMLMHLVQNVVMDKFNIMLEPEVRIIQCEKNA